MINFEPHNIEIKINKENEFIENDYSYVLNNLGIEHTINGYYLQVGTIEKVQGWILHISVILSQALELIENITPYLIREGIPFKIPLNKKVTNALLAGNLGYHKLGKIICIYPQTEKIAIAIAQQLIHETKLTKGPSIPTDHHLGGNVYTRYGSFNPIILSSQDGKIEKYIYSNNGTLQKDINHIPFFLPHGVNWPFSDIKKYEVSKPKRIIGKHYLQIQLLKKDAKGQVIKCLNIKNWFSLTMCVIKEGRNNMCYDEFGRSIKDRLLWQFEVHKDLEKYIPIPKTHEFFSEEGNDYLVMDYVEGKGLNEFITEEFQGNSWINLSKFKKEKIFKYLLQILTIIENLHNKGYVHRDLNPANFLVTAKGKIVVIDIELCYSFFKAMPSPAFQMGTPGFMSADQLAGVTPTTKDDIYALGCFMIQFFTGISPTKFNNSDITDLKINLNYFIQDSFLVNVITSCLNDNAELRPSINEISLNLKSYFNKHIIGTYKQPKVNFEGPNPETVHDIIKQSIKSLSTPKFSSIDKIWFSKVIDEKKDISNELTEFTIYPGLHEGISGILYCLSKAKKAGIDISDSFEIIESNWQFLKLNYLNKCAELNPCLYSGTAGILLTIYALFDAGLINHPEYFSKAIFNSFYILPKDLNIGNGLSGIGISMLHCLSFCDKNILEPILEKYIENILLSQLKDGSWILTKEIIQTKGIKLYSFSYGIAGIIYFLQLYYSYYKNPKVKKSILMGLEWMIKQRCEKNGYQIWTLHPKNKSIDPWLDYGYSGIALTYIKAYELFNEAKYKAAAESALKSHPLNVCSNYLTLSFGLAGLGEIYLEAYNAFKDQEWLQRANWIAGALTNMAIRQPDNSIYWQADYDTKPTADFMVGNSGIIHFLIRYYTNAKISFPFFSL